MEERDWQRDWDACEKATPGPWGFGVGDRLSGTPAVVCQLGADGRVSGPFIAQVGRNESHKLDDQCYRDAHFICAAREALPYWLRRVKELEERLRQLEGRQCETCLWWIPWDNGKWGTCDKGAPPDDPKIRRYLMMETRPDFGCACWEARG